METCDQTGGIEVLDCISVALMVGIAVIDIVDCPCLKHIYRIMNIYGIIIGILFLSVVR